MLHECRHLARASLKRWRTWQCLGNVCRYLLGHINIGVAWLFNMVYSLALVFGSTWMVVNWAPQAAGAGVAEVMAYLNGCMLPHVGSMPPFVCQSLFECSFGPMKALLQTVTRGVVCVRSAGFFHFLRLLLVLPVQLMDDHSWLLHIEHIWDALAACQTTMRARLINLVIQRHRRSLACRCSMSSHWW